MRLSIFIHVNAVHLHGADTHLFIICVHKVNNGLFGFFLLHQIQAWCVWIWNVPKPV